MILNNFMLMSQYFTNGTNRKQGKKWVFSQNFHIYVSLSHPLLLFNDTLCHLFDKNNLLLQKIAYRKHFLLLWVFTIRSKLNHFDP